MHDAMGAAGFEDTRTLHFPQPIYPTGWWSATLARKGGVIALERGAAAEAPGFDTDYYTAEMHRAAFAQPAFVRRALGERG